MPMSERDRSILEHIISYCRDIEDTVERFGNSFEVFSSDKIYRNACAMCILQIGELGGHLSQEFRSSYPQMPWSEIKGMRNVMAHAYGSLSIQTTWESDRGRHSRTEKFLHYGPKEWRIKLNRLKAVCT